MSDNVKVSIKVRPLIKREKDSKLSPQWRIRDNTIAPIDGNGDPFVFDHIFDETVSTRDLFDTVCRPVILSAIKGINGTIFAYGQTSSGKTYTMIGDDREPGVLPLTAKEIFDQIKKIKERQFLIRVGFIEIYNEKIHDLLNTANTNMKIVENQCGDVSVNSKEFITNCAEHIILYVDMGNKERKSGETNMNERSSRSHTIFRITIESRAIGEESGNEAVQIGILNLVDLAGSERADQTGATGSRFKEGVCINRSLLSLSCVIQKLSENSDKQFINYRDSKLTRILQASLGGNAVTSMICNVTPAAFDETYYTLCFAMRAKNIRNKPKVNEILTDAAMMKRLEQEIKRLQNELRSEQSKNSKIKTVELQNAITLRTNQIINPNQMSSTNTDNARRRTWCPTTSEIPRLHNNGRPLSGASDGHTLMGPPSTTGPYLASMCGRTPNIAIRTIPADEDQRPQENGFRATLALMNDDRFPIACRDLETRRVRSTSPTGNDMLNPFITYGDEFVPGEQISFGHGSLSPLSIMARDMHTPKSLRRNRRSSTGDSPTHLDYEARCRVLEQELIELQEFTKLENSVELECMKNELANRDKHLASLIGDIDGKNQQIEQLEERCTHLAIELKEQKTRVSKAEDQLALVVKERQAAVRAAEQHSNQLTGIEFEYERFRLRSEAREKELIESLQEARGSSGVATPNNGDSFRLDQKREEMKRLEMQNYDFSLQLEERNKQIEQLKSSYLEQQRKLEQVKQVVLQHHNPASAIGTNKSEAIISQSLVSPLRKLLFALEDGDTGDHVSQPSEFHDTSLADRTNGHDAKATTIGEEHTVQELLKIIETLEKSLKVVELEGTTKVESNEQMLIELKSKLDSKIALVEELEKQLKQCKNKFDAQTSEYDELSTQLLDQVQDSENIQREHESLKLKYSTMQQEAEACRMDFAQEMAKLSKTFEKVTDENGELKQVSEMLRKEIAMLQKSIEANVVLIETIEKEKNELADKWNEVTESMDEAISQKKKLYGEIEALKIELADQADVKNKMDNLRQTLKKQDTDLKSLIEEQRSEKEALAKENARLLEQLELLQKNKLDDVSTKNHPKTEQLESVIRREMDERLELYKMELQEVQNDQQKRIQIFSEEKESLEKANKALRMEIERLQELLNQLKEDNENLLSSKENGALEQGCSERVAMAAELENAKQCQHLQEKRMSELQDEVVRYRNSLETIQKEYTALVEKQTSVEESYEASHVKLNKEIELAKETIEQLQEKIAIVTQKEAHGREELDKVQLSQKTLELRIVDLENEVKRHVSELDAARIEHDAIMDKHKEDRENFDNFRLKLMEEMEIARKQIETLTEEKNCFMKQQPDEHKKQESLVARIEELTNCKGTLEKHLEEKEEEICKHMAALETAWNEQNALAEQQKADRDSHEAAQQKLVAEMDLLKSNVDRLAEEKHSLTKMHTDGIARQQLLEQQLNELVLGKNQLSLQVAEREAEILKHITELDTLRAEQLRLVEQYNTRRRELEDRNKVLEKELDALQHTVEQLMGENESLLKEQLDDEASQKCRLAEEFEEMEKLRLSRDESERLVAQLGSDLTMARDELEVVRSELLEEKRRNDESEQSQKARVQSMTEEIERLNSSIVALEDEKQRLREAERRLLTQLEENKKHTVELEHRQEEMESFREELRKENSDLTIAVQELSAKLVNLEEQMDGNEAAQTKTIDSLLREKQAQEEVAQQAAKEVTVLRQQLTETVEKLADLRHLHTKVLEELREVKCALDENTALRVRLEADIEESSSVRDVLERELRELKSELESLDSKLAKERYAQERQVSDNLRRELSEKQKELESFMATGRPSLGDGRVVQALRRENEDLLKQLNEALQINGLKGNQLQERVDELQRLETEIERLRDEMATMRHESSFNEKEVQITELRQKVTEVEKVREETVHQKRSLERAFDQMRFKNQTLAKEVDELRRTTDKERKSRRQSTHDDRRGLLFNSKEVSTMTDPTSTDCSCREMDALIKELRNKLTLKDCQLNTQKLISSANPLKNEIVEIRRKLEDQNREKNLLEQELRGVLAEMDKERKERKRHCTQCIRHSRQQNARCDKAVQAYQPSENAAAVSVSIVSTTRTASTGTPGKAANTGEAERLNILQNRCDEQQEQYTKLMEKYQTMKQLCRLRNEKIVSLSQEITEKENETTTVSRSMQNECMKLKQQLKESETQSAQINRIHHQGTGKAMIKSEVGVQTEIDSSRNELDMYRNKYEQYKALAKKLMDDASAAKRNGQRSTVMQ